MRTRVWQMALLSSVTAIMMSGCGGGSSSSTSVSSYDVTVERGPVLGARVTDSAGQTAQEIGGGRYRFANAPVYPLYAGGGVIDVNRDGTVSPGDVPNLLTLLSSEGAALTLVNSVAANAEIRAYLKSTYGLSDAQIDSATPSSDKTIAAISDELYAYMLENGIYDPTQISLETMQALQTQIQTRIAQYAGAAESTAQLEAQLVQQLAERQKVRLLSSADVARMQTAQNAQSAATAPATGTLSVEQKSTIAYMWNEEKLAKDIYFALNALYPNRALENIAANSETQHEATMQSFAQKYDVNVFNLTDYSGGYDEAGMNALAAGEYTIPAIKSLYDTLYAKGSQSAQDALEVGCMVEVTDINDLNERIAEASDVPDLVQAFEFLRNGSYNHYWAFDSALKGMGVSEGCCVLGSEYCKTPEEYPANNGMANGGTGAGHGPRR